MNKNKKDYQKEYKKQHFSSLHVQNKIEGSHKRSCIYCKAKFKTLLTHQKTCGSLKCRVKLIKRGK